MQSLITTKWTRQGDSKIRANFCGQRCQLFSVRSKYIINDEDATSKKPVLWPKKKSANRKRKKPRKIRVLSYGQRIKSASSKITSYPARKYIQKKVAMSKFEFKFENSKFALVRVRILRAAFESEIIIEMISPEALPTGDFSFLHFNFSTFTCR